MATLSNLVDETTNIKSELKTCHTNLKNNLVDKGVSISNGDKLGDLVNKVSGIKCKVVASDNIMFETIKLSKAIEGNVYVDVFSVKAPLGGSIRFSVTYSPPNSSYTAYLKFSLIRDGSLLKEKEYTTKSNVVLNHDFEDIKLGDNLIVATKCSSSAYWSNINKICVMGDIV